MVADFLQLLKKVCEGDTQAWQTLHKLFVEHALSADEQTQAFTYVRRTAKTNVYAIYAQALFYDNGLGTKQDFEMAFIVMREAATHGHADAIFEVGRRFLYGIGVEKNYESALRWLMLAASSPHYHPGAMYHLGLMYEQGLGVQQDAEQAQKWMREAEEKGYKHD